MLPDYYVLVLFLSFWKAAFSLNGQSSEEVVLSQETRSIPTTGASNSFTC